MRAKLETPLRPGETTLLQVQPPGENGITVMKPMTGTLAELPQASLNNLLKDVGLPDTKGNRELLLAMQRSGLPLTKDNVAMVQNMMTAKPAQVPVEEWVQATGIAFQRGLPVTAETVKGLHQTVFGPPLHQLLSGLADQLETMLTQTTGKPLLPGEQSDAMKPTVVAGVPVVLNEAQMEEGLAASGNGRQVTGTGTPALSTQQGQAALAGSKSMTDGGTEDAGTAVKGNVQTGGGTANAEAGAKAVASNVETAGKGVQVFRLEPEYLARARAGLTRAKSGAARVHRGRQQNLWLAVQVQASLKQARPVGLTVALKRLLLRGAVRSRPGSASSAYGSAAGAQAADAAGRLAQRVHCSTGRPCIAGRPGGCGCRRRAAAVASRR